MIDAFEDVRREYANRYGETHGVLLADSYDRFVTKLLHAIMTALNEDPDIMSVMDAEMISAIRDGLTPAQWSRKKASILQTMFFLTLDECPPMKHEFAIHLYNELRKEPTHE